MKNREEIKAKEFIERNKFKEYQRKDKKVQEEKQTELKEKKKPPKN